MRDDPLIALAVVFVPFSLISIGGGSAVISGIHNETVNIQGWLTEQEFLSYFAVARAAPGPGSMLATLIGWKLDGWLGAAVATLAFFVPAAALCYVVNRLSSAHKQKKWHVALREGLAPVGVGLTIAASISIFRISGGGIIAGLISAAAAGTFLLAPRVPVLVVLLAGAAIGYATVGI